MIGIVGNGRDKFTELGYNRAYNIVVNIINSNINEQICSGNSPMLGIDYLVKQNTPSNRYIEYNPVTLKWNNGYRERNLQIAKSRIVYVIVANKYPKEYKGIKFESCYHCKSMNKDYNNHIKSGACWTAKQAIKLGNESQWMVINNFE